MKSISYKLALQRAKTAGLPTEVKLLICAEAGDRNARGYLRALYTTEAEYNALNPRPRPDEDGPCAGFGCDVTLIY